MAGGLASRGVRVRYAGVITTPGVAYLTRTGPFAAGVMISASHNPYQDNGIKVFGHSGFKLPDAEEHAIEQKIFRAARTRLEPQPAALAVDDEPGPPISRFLLSTVAGALRRRAAGDRLRQRRGLPLGARAVPRAWARK